MCRIGLPQSLDEVGREWVGLALLGDQVGDGLPEFTLEPMAANNSSKARLVFKACPHKHGLPTSLILKLCADGHGFLGASEPDYYRRDYIGLENSPLVHCHRAVGPGAMTQQSAGQGYALFLEDLTGDYTDNKGIPPTARHAAELGAALGRLHAHRWGVDADPDGPHDLEADFQRFMAHVATGLDPILDEMGEALAPSRRERLVKVFTDDAARMRDRAIRGNGLTLLHGDPNPTNVLTPVNASIQRQPLYLIDRQPFAWSLRVWLGAADLVHAAVPYWGIDNRRACQDTILRSYHRALRDNGVRDYSLGDLYADWKICACLAAMKAVEWASDPGDLKDMKWLWERQIDRALALLEDCDAGLE